MSAPDTPAFLTARDRTEVLRGDYAGRASMVIVLDPDRRVLLNLRDDDPKILYPNHWAILGGGGEPGETPTDTARRELDEEIGLKPHDNEIGGFCALIDRGGHRHLVSVFVAHTSVKLDDLELREGQDLRFFGFSELHDLRLTLFVREVLDAYFQQHR